MKRLITFAAILLSLCANAQKGGKITATITNEKKAVIENASVELLRSKDSSLVKVAITNKEGVAEFENVKPGSYLLKATHVSQEKAYSQKIELEEGKVETTTLLMAPKATSLQQVNVAAKRPFIQKLRDRLVVNVDNSVVNAGSTAMEVLERSPGVNVDRDDNISLRGKQGVIVMIDGKPSPMTGTDLANYLRGLPSNAIDRIEIITNPSAKYDAAGNSGIIDIRLKKDQRMGANGTYTAGYGQGVYAKANTGATFNYRNKKVNIFGSYNYAYRIGLNHLIIERTFLDNGKFAGADMKDNYNKPHFSSHTSRLGADFFPSKKTIIGFVVNGNFNHFKRRNDNNSVIFDEAGDAASTFTALATNNDHNNNYFGNVNFKHRFDSTGKELTADIDYGQYSTNSLSSVFTQYFNLDGSMQKPDYLLNGQQDGKLIIRTAKADYTNPLAKEAKLEAGFKTSYVSSDNNAQFFDASSGTPVNDESKTNRFYYDEYNNAGYLNFSKEWKKFNVQFGLRGENTHIKTRQVKGDIRFDSSYFQLFPSAFFNYKLKEDQTLGISVSRRIDRPGYSQLNPFLFLIDVSTYATGSPGLLPQFTWSYEASYTYKNLNFALSYSHTTNDQNIAIARFKDVFPNIPSDDNVTVQIPVNLKSSDYYGLTVSAPVKINKWWNMINNGNFYYQQYNGQLGATVLNNGKPAFDVTSNNSFTLKKGWTTELNGTYNSGGQYGFMVAKPQWGISAGAQKMILKNKGTLKFNITDIFWTNLPEGDITYVNYKEHWHAYRETRVATLSFTYRFGKTTVQGARRRTTGSEDERRRAGN
jgi:iron complex outermembrane recepter protein